MDKGAKQLGRRMLSVYRQLDEPLQKFAADNGATCQKGCAHCCNRQVFISMPEAVAIAEDLLLDPAKAADVVRRCYEMLPRLKLDANAHFKQAIPCVFLTGEKECGVYDSRPMPCRHHFVASPPSDCSPMVDGTTVVRLNTQKVDAFVMQESLRVSKQRQVPVLLAPIPVAVLWAMKLLSEGENEFMKSLSLPEDLGIFDIRGWTQHALNSVAATSQPLITAEGVSEREQHGGGTQEGGPSVAGEGGGGSEGEGTDRA